MDLFWDCMTPWTAAIFVVTVCNLKNLPFNKRQYESICSKTLAQFFYFFCIILQFYFILFNNFEYIKENIY